MAEVNLPSSARKVLRTLANPGEATFDELFLRVRSMSEQGLLRSLYLLESRGLIHLSNHDGCATITDAGREALRV